MSETHPERASREETVREETTKEEQTTDTGIVGDDSDNPEEDDQG